jgi:hypothetical protein
VDLRTTTNDYFEDFILTELNQSPKECKNNKALGTDNINVELFKYSRPSFKERLWIFLIEFCMVKIVQKTGKSHYNAII